MPDHNYFANLIWQIADLLRGPYRPPQYERVMLPMTVLRRFDCVLEPTKQAVLKRHARLKEIRCILEHLLPLPKAVVATASFAGLRRGELRGLEWPDLKGESLTVNRSIWKKFVNGPKTRASAQAVPVIRQLAEILNAYRISMGNPATGVMFHSGDGIPMDLDKLAQRVIRPLVKSIGMEWYGWHGFRRGIASNLYELGADEKVVQRILRHAKSHVTKERYIKAFDPAVLAAMKKLETSLDAMSQSAPKVHQIN